MREVFCGETCVMQLSMFADKYGVSVSIRIGGCYPYGELKIRHTVVRPSGESIRMLKEIHHRQEMSAEWVSQHLICH